MDTLNIHAPLSPCSLMDPCLALSKNIVALSFVNFKIILVQVLHFYISFDVPKLMLDVFLVYAVLHTVIWFFTAQVRNLVAYILKFLYNDVFSFNVTKCVFDF